MTRKPTASTTTSVMVACQFQRGRNISADCSVKIRSAPGADDAVPFFGELGPVLLEGVPVGWRQQLHVLERHAVGRRRHVGTRRMQQQRVAERLLADRREEPV